MKTFMPGDTVRLRLGGIVMIVVQHFDHIVNDGVTVPCVYLEKHRRVCGLYRPNHLIVISRDHHQQLNS